MVESGLTFLWSLNFWPPTLPGVPDGLEGFGQTHQGSVS
jgi:hypothetical protein